MLFKKYSRPFDPTGSSILNLIIGETRQIANADDRIFIPSHGPYYTASLVVMANGSYLKKGVDYNCILLHREATKATAKEVGCGVQILKAGLAEITIDYQCVGGQYQSVYVVLKDQVDGMGSASTLNPVKFNEIIGRPTLFNAAAHRHPYWEFQGWDILVPPLDQIKNAILARKKAKVQNIFDYLDVKQLQYQSTLDNQVNQLSLDIRTIYDRFKDPVGTVRLTMSPNNPGELRDGGWDQISDRILFKTATNATLGSSVGLSDEIVYPQPDNILLNESDVPIMRDDDEWLYLDNQYPVKPSAGDGRELTDLFNVLYVKGHVKKVMGNSYNASVSADRDSMNEGDTVVVTLTTYKYSPGLEVPYQITGINDSNINIARTGKVVIDGSGKATLTITLVNGGPRTDTTALTVYFLIQGGVSKTINYTLASNQVYTARLNAFVGMTEVVEKQHVLGDRFYLRIDPQGLSGKNVRLSGFFDGTGTHQLWFNGQQANGVNGGYRDFMMPSDGSGLWIEVYSVPTTDTAVTALNFNVQYNSSTIANLSVPSTAFMYNAVWIDPTTNQPITTIRDDRPFQLKITHNSKQVIAFPITVAENTLGSELNPVPNALVQSNLSGSAFSQQFMANRNDRAFPDHLTIWVRNPYLNSKYLINTITIPVEG